MTPSDPAIAEKFNTYRFADKGEKGEGDRLVEEGDDGEGGDAGDR